ncbi:MAG TPA: PfkB family carbohydrate kinase, partial [Syntrophales bacterium]|jgi:sugar/nucleoside kinase (ribokinase family)|nr:PfkB family carbohydrate kinase [Syntrophales bacterium]
LIRKAAYPAKTIDTTGCGDLFHAGVAYGILHDWDPEKSLDLGAWAASSVSTQLGGRKGIPSLNELEEKYGEN